jgi:TRAP-type C4-dicarboxylate transport system permease small subunit
MGSFNHFSFRETTSHPNSFVVVVVVAVAVAVVISNVILPENTKDSPSWRDPA